MSLFKPPYSEQVDANVLQTLQGVNAANGFQVTLSPVGFPDVSGQTSPTDMRCVIHVGDDVEAADEDTPSNYKQWKRPYGFMIYIMKDPDVLKGTRFETWANVIRAEVERAIVSDPYRGGTAQNTELHNPVTFADANDVQGIIVFATVTYRTLYEDPYTK